MGKNEWCCNRDERRVQRAKRLVLASRKEASEERRVELTSGLSVRRSVLWPRHEQALPLSMPRDLSPLTLGRNRDVIS